LIAFSQRMVAAKAQKKTHLGMSDEPALPLLRTRTVAAVATILNVPVLIVWGERKLTALVAEWFKGRPSEYLFLSVYFVLLLLFMLSPQIMLVVASKRRLKATCIVILATVFFFITVTGTLIAATPEELASPSFTLLFFLISSGVIAAMLAIAPANSLFKRL